MRHHQRGAYANELAPPLGRRDQVLAVRDDYGSDLSGIFSGAFATRRRIYYVACMRAIVIC
jgi:hypothetical protein